MDQLALLLENTDLSEIISSEIYILVVCGCGTDGLIPSASMDAAPEVFGSKILLAFRSVVLYVYWRKKSLLLPC